MIQWWIDSLHRETGGDYTGIRVLVIDKFFGTPGRHPIIPREMSHVFEHHPVKPSVWQGPHRLTKEDWWDVPGARNTALCYAPDGWIVFCDDLSVLMPGFLARVREAAAANNIVCGSYRKVKKLIVNNGAVVSFEDFPGGFDGRRTHARGTGVTPCRGQWMYGCCLAAPVEAFLSINGYDERCCGLSFEDCITGIHLEKKGWKFVFDPLMQTYESEEHHHAESSAKRSDYGKSPLDKSHAILDLANTGDGWCPNDFCGKTLRELRDEILVGASFPIPTKPDREWFTGTPLAELT